MAPRLFLAVLATVLVAALAQPPPIPGYDPSALADNVKKFSEVYGLATQIMNMGGRFLGNSGGSGTGGTGSPGLTSSANYNHNGILGEVVRPQFRGVGGNEYGENSLFENRPSPSSSLFSEYGGGPLGGGTKPVQRQSAIASIMNTFLGSSLGGSSSGSSGYEPYSPSSSGGGGGGGGLFGGVLPDFSGYGGSSSSSSSSSSGSDINGILAQLMRSGAKPAQPEPAGPASFISQLFGVGR
uniref:DUF148 domain-containing protein n=1 Tax=Steinernema glaseri TaxID=37863 RepID=A0A1I7YWC7_9BILA